MKLDKLIGGERFTRIPIEDSNKIYIFDRLIFIGIMIFLVVLMLILIISNGGFSSKYNFYVRCNNTIGVPTLINNSEIVFNMGCENPLYRDTKYCGMAWAGACEQKTLPNGFTYGEPRPKFMNWFIIISILSILAGFIINHNLYNKGGGRVE